MRSALHHNASTIALTARLAITACLATIAAVAAPTANAQLLDNLKPDTLILSAEELRWIEQKLSPEERALLDSTRGMAPPAFPETTTFIGSDPISWQDLRGRVVVIQSWSSATSEGRPLPKRVERILSAFDPNDVLPIFVHTPDGADTAPAFIERLGVTSPIAIDRSGLFLDEMGIFRRPVISIIDRSGKVRYAGISIASLETAVRALIRETHNADAPPPNPMTPRDQRTVAVVGPDTTGLRNTTFEYPRIREDDRPTGNDLRGKPFTFDPTSVTAVHLGGALPDGPRVGIFIIAQPQTTSTDLVTRLNRWSSREAQHYTITGIMGATPRIAGAWANTMNPLWTVMADEEGKNAEALQLNDTDLPYAYITSPDLVVRWQGPARDISESLLNQIARASGVKRDNIPADGQTGPRSVQLPRWRDTIPN